MSDTNGAGEPHEPPALNAKQVRLIELLCGGSTIVAASSQLQVNESTARRWLKLSHVEQAYKVAKDGMYTQLLASLKRQSLVALNKHIMATDIEPNAASQLRAVALVFEFEMRQRELTEVVAKLQELEHLLQERG